MKKETLKSIAAKRGVHVTTVSRWKASGCDVFSDAALDEFLAGQKHLPTTGKASAAKLNAARLAKLKAEGERARLSVDVLKGSYMPRKVVEREQAKIAHVCNMLLRAIPAELPPLTAGLTPAKIEKILKDWACDWADRLKAADSDLWKAAEDVIVADLRGDARRAALKTFAEADRERRSD